MCRIGRQVCRSEAREELSGAMTLAAGSRGRQSLSGRLGPVVSERSRVLPTRGGRQQPSDSTDLLIPELLIFEVKPETQTSL